MIHAGLQGLATRKTVAHLSAAEEVRLDQAAKRVTGAIKGLQSRQNVSEIEAARAAEMAKAASTLAAWLQSLNAKETVSKLEIEELQSAASALTASFHSMKVTESALSFPSLPVHTTEYPVSFCVEHRLGVRPVGSSRVHSKMRWIRSLQRHTPSPQQSTPRKLGN